MKFQFQLQLVIFKIFEVFFNLKFYDIFKFKNL